MTRPKLQTFAGRTHGWTPQDTKRRSGFNPERLASPAGRGVPPGSYGLPQHMKRCNRRMCFPVYGYELYTRQVLTLYFFKKSL